MPQAEVFKVGMNEVASGLHPDLEKGAAPFWEEGENVFFRGGIVSPFPGQVQLLSKLEVAPVRGAIEVEHVGTPNLFWGSQKNLYRFALGGVVEEISVSTDAYTGIVDATPTQRATMWSFARWGLWTAATNGVDTPQLRKTGDFVNIGGTPPFSTAEIFRILNPFLIALNTSNGNDIYEWCDEDDVETWIPTTSNSAGDKQIRELGSGIIAAEPLGAGLVAYGRNRCSLISIVAAPFFLGDLFLTEGIGAVSKNSVAVSGRRHYGFGPRGIWEFDGTSFVYIDTPSVHRYVFDDLNEDQISKTIAWPNQALDLVSFFYPSANSIEPNRGVFFDPHRRVWGKLAFGRTAGTTGAVFAFPIAMDERGNVFQQVLEEQPPAEGGNPLVMTATYEMQVGFGMGGFGKGGFGGEVTGGG